MPPWSYSATRFPYTTLFRSVNPPTPTMGMSSGNLMPIVQVAPQYPRAAISRGIEGFVTLRNTVTTTGRTRDPVVISATTTDETPTSEYDRAAIDVGQNIRYGPHVAHGERAEEHNARTRLR